ncbi:MAG: Hint domain-containing protein [Roseobacter sp.]|jgi:hypothetical protein|nr:Hint domain-containing protein [Roseobacter sp.]
MPTHFGYKFALRGSQTSDGENGDPIDYRFNPPSTWRYSGSNEYFVVEEARTNNRTFDGDPENEVVQENMRIGENRAQTVEIDGTDRQVFWDYTFTVGLDDQVWRIGVIDVDLDNSNMIEAGAENGYFLVFPDGLPPPDTDLNFLEIIENDNGTQHSKLGGEVVCFVAGTLIETQSGPRAIETLAADDLIVTRDGGLQPLRWIGNTSVPAQGKLAPVVISAGVLGNSSDLIVSPQHAVLIDDWRAELLYGDDEVLVRAIDLLDHDGIYRMPGGVVEYYHLLFDAHHLVRASGIWSESLFPGDFTKATITPAARAEIETLFPDLKGYGPKSARCLRRFEAVCLAS